MGEETQRKIFKVAELTRLIKSTLENNVGTVWVEGELSNVKQPTSGHYYLTIKDASSQISAVMFKGNQRSLKFQPKDGLLVRVLGEISVYEQRGSYQIIVRKMEEGGKGSLQEQFEKLKEKLRLEGLFSEDRKKAIPILPQHVGVVTSATGAAIRDILNVITRRFPNLHVVVAPVKVQGDGSAQEIAEAIDLFNKIGGIDVLIVGRGGGSLEDLWCFNEEVVARAIARSKIPVISAVGHEVDFTISDFVADMRAPTPSAAAELVVERKDAFEELLEKMSQRLARSLRERVLLTRNRLVAAGGSYVFKEPGNLVKRYMQVLDKLGTGMRHSLVDGLREAQQRIDDHGLRMEHMVKIKQQSFIHELKRFEMQLRALNPNAVLGRGYSITRDEKGRIIKSEKDVKSGQRIVTQVSKGKIESEVVD